MSVEAVGAVMHGLFGADPSAKLVMLIIAEHARRGSALAWPSIDTIARLSCLQRRQVQAIISRLVEAGWMSLERRGGGRVNGQGGLPNIYKLNLKRLNEGRRNSAADNTVNDAVENTVNRALERTVNDAADNTVAGDLSTERSLTVQPSAPLTVQSDAKKGAVGGGEPCSPASKNRAAGCLQTGFEPLLKATGEETGSMHAPARDPDGGAVPIGQIANRLKKRLEPERHTAQLTPTGELPREEIERRRQEQLTKLAAMMQAKP